MTKYNEETGKWACEFCEEYTEVDRRKVNMHEIHCKKKFEGDNQPPEPEGQPVLQDGEVVEQLTQEPPKRRERVPFGTPQTKLPSFKDDGYVYRIFNDNWQKEPGRILRAKQAGYEEVPGYEHITVGKNDDLTPIKGVVMRIPKAWYEEDQKLKQKEVDKVDEAIRKGTLEQGPGENRYTPQGIKIHASFNEPK